MVLAWGPLSQASTRGHIQRNKVHGRTWNRLERVSLAKAVQISPDPRDTSCCRTWAHSWQCRGVDGTELWIMKGSFGTVTLPCSILKFHKDLKRLGNYDV